MSGKIPCITWSIPKVAFQAAWVLQQKQISKIAAGISEATIFILEHYPVITIGRKGNDTHVLIPETELHKKGIECIHIDRGGDVTFHGPGQLVVYLMLPLIGVDRDIHKFIRRIEAVGIKVLDDFGLMGQTIQGYTGVWVDDKKIMAIGVGVRKWVTFHGLAFNFSSNLEGFNWIIPCGIKDKGVTSLHLLMNKIITREEIEEKFKIRLAEEFGLCLKPSVNPLNYSMAK